MTGNFPACRVNTRSNVAASPLALGESRCRNGWQLSTVSLLLAAGFHGGLTHRPHCLLMGYIRPFGPARNGFRALHPCTISALAMLLDTILPTSKTIDPLAWDGIVYAALTGGASKAVFDEELPQLFGCGDWTRTSDLRLMGPTSYHCSTPQYEKHPHHHGCKRPTVLGLSAHHSSLTVSESG